jgi:preprotein translocase subunit YajC
MMIAGVSLLLADQQMAPNPTGMTIKTLVMFGAFAVFMWVLMIAPQRKKAKQQEAMLATLRGGDRVVTASGIVGVVLSIKDKTVSIRSADAKLEVLKSAISEVTSSERGGESGEAKS